MPSTQLDSERAHPRAARDTGRPPRAPRRGARRGAWRAPGFVSATRDATYRRCLAAADMLVFLAVLVLATELARGAVLSPWVLPLVPLGVLTAKISGLYDRDDVVLRKTTLDEAPRIFQLSALFALALWLVSDHLLGGALHHLDVIDVWFALFVGLMLGRCAARAVARNVSPAERCLFIGDRADEGRLNAKLRHGGGVKANVVARAPLDPVLASARQSEDDLKADLLALLAQTEAQRVVIAPRTAAANDVLDLVRALRTLGVRVSLLPCLFEVVGSSVEFDDVHGLTLLGVRRFDITRSSRLVKRWFDLTLTLTVLVLLAPVLLLLALAIKLDSRGPVLFFQERVGRDGGRFRMAKFRTMVADAERMKSTLSDHNEAADGFFKMERDPRVTRVGRFLRQTSLDELPQLLNVVRGEMSLVGPRPLIVEEDGLISGWQRSRLHLTPGMTGHWQILGSSRVPMSEMIAIDHLYAANWSLWNDVKILLRTIPYVLGGQSR